MIPDTEVCLLSNVPLDINLEHTIDFLTKEEQYNYFDGFTSYRETNYTYEKGLGTIKIDIPFDELQSCNYMMFRNSDFTNKWFYAFITQKEYINPTTTRVYYELDPFQTWQFELRWNPSYIEREHTRRWASGKPVINTIEENINYGTEYDIVHVQHVEPFYGYKFLVIVSKEKLHGSGGLEPTIIGSPQPLSYYIIPFKDDDTTPKVIIGGMDYPISPPTHVLKEIYKYENAVNNIVSMYVTEYFGVPVTVSPGNPDVMQFQSGVFDPVTIGNWDGSIAALYVKEIKEFQKYTFSLSYDKYLGFRATDESKLMMYPYCVTILDDKKGNRIELKNEYIREDYIEISMYGSLGLSNKMAWTVTNYNHNLENVASDLEHALVNDNPQDLAIINDYLSAYLQGNRNSLQQQRAQIQFSSMLGLAGGLFAGPVGSVLGLAGTVGNAYMQIQALNAKLKDIDNHPPEVAKLGGNTAFDYGNRLTGIYIIKKQIKPEYMTILEDYFHAYGYRVNRIKYPNLRSRKHWNFVKTVGANIYGNIPADDLKKIKDMFDNGVTLWHGNHIGNYELSNEEI